MSTTPVNPPAAPAYPVTFDVDYPARPLDRLISFLHLITAIPIAIIIGLLTNATMRNHREVKGKEK